MIKLEKKSKISCVRRRHGESEWSEVKQIYRKMLKKNEWKCMQQKEENNRKVTRENEVKENEVKERKPH